ncbi:MAG TPA: hypothetical protein VHY09_05415 [Candidatus Methylacidiphilales bacterium]|jgi:hypothetical protein|nr:hypothetical protein [Candidatus Methylacidiphilales bacterium]
MAAPSELDKLIAEYHEQHPCSIEKTLLRYAAIKPFLDPLISLAGWLVELFNPPPLKSMTLFQKTGRILLFTASLVIGSILFAMAGALGLYLMERGRELRDTPQFYHGLLIVMVGVGVNIGCVFVLLQIKKADHKLLPPEKK